MSSPRGVRVGGEIKDPGSNEDGAFVLDFGDESDLLIFVKSKCGGATFGVGGCTGGVVGIDGGKDMGESMTGIGDMGGCISEKAWHIEEILVFWGMGDSLEETGDVRLGSLAPVELFSRPATHLSRAERPNKG